MLKFSNFGKALIGSAPSGATGLNFTVEAGKGVNFPTLDAGDYFYGIFKDASGNREIVKIEARSGDAMTIAVGGRGLDGTTARTWNAGDYFVAGLPNIALQETLSNANLIALGALTSAADKLPYFIGSGEAALADLTAFARTLLDDADATAARTTLGIDAAIKAVMAANLPSSSQVLFYNSSAPTGWTQNTNANDYAIRLVNGTGGTPSNTGSPFSVAFANRSLSGSVGYHNLTVAELPPIVVTIPAYLTSGAGSFISRGGSGSSPQDMSANSFGSGNGHTHSFSGTLDMRVRYIDMILCIKNAY